MLVDHGDAGGHGIARPMSGERPAAEDDAAAVGGQHAEERRSHRDRFVMTAAPVRANPDDLSSTITCAGAPPLASQPMYLRAISASQGQGASGPSGDRGAPTECMQGMNGPSPSTSSTLAPMRVMIFMLTTT